MCTQIFFPQKNLESTVLKDYYEIQPQESKEHSMHYSFNKRITINLCQACPLQQETCFCYLTNSVLVSMERMRKVNYTHVQGSG